MNKTHQKSLDFDIEKHLIRTRGEEVFAPQLSALAGFAATMALIGGLGSYLVESNGHLINGEDFSTYMKGVWTCMAVGYGITQIPNKVTRSLGNLISRNIPLDHEERQFVSNYDSLRERSQNEEGFFDREEVKRLPYNLNCILRRGKND